MKAYKLEILVIDFDDIGADGAAQEIESACYGNHCISPVVMSVVSRDIGEWNDEHPLNNFETRRAEYVRLFDESNCKLCRES